MRTLVIFLLACCPAYALPPEKEKLLPPRGKTIVMPNAAANSEHVDVFRTVTGYSPTGHKFWMNLDDPDYLQLHEQMEPCNERLMITLLFARDLPGQELNDQGDKLGRVINGDHDATLEKLGRELKSFGKPVYLDIGNEAEFFYPKNPGEFVKAYRHVYEKLKPLCSDNVLFFWHTVNDIRAIPASMKWYPGDEFVDGVGISIYTDGQFRSAETYVSYARKRKKAIAVFECGLAPHKASENNGSVWDYTWKGYHQRLLNLVESKNIPILGYAGYGDEVFHEPGPYHHNRLDYLAPDIQKGWSDTLRRPRYRP